MSAELSESAVRCHPPAGCRGRVLKYLCLALKRRAGQHLALISLSKPITFPQPREAAFHQVNYFSSFSHPRTGTEVIVLLSRLVTKLGAAPPLRLQETYRVLTGETVVPEQTL